MRNYKKECLRLCFVIMLLFLYSCNSSSPTSLSSDVYIPSWGDRAEKFADWPEGSLGRDFHWACSSKDLTTAVKRWQAFLEKHAGQDGAFEDAFHWNHVIYAKQELLRVYYLLGKVDEGDRLLREFDPVKGSFRSVLSITLVPKN